MSRPPLNRTAVWVRERACVPLVLAEARGAAVRSASAQVTELASARQQPGRRARRRRAA
ncbi:hypothetical protein ACFQ9V_06030 [Leifsonia sp. NPDC056665]|uniref:hypothetical protein n=1 Tax=Leifsonia sp. NPDC056665 TaxID=3345901 RepID=UPI003682FE27